MSIRKVNFVRGEYYHIYNRGNSKQKIFHDKEDYQYFLRLLFIANGEEKFKFHFLEGNVYEAKRGNQLVAIGAYVLMPNHFHLLITEIEEGGISKFLHKVSSGYSHYYNKKYERTGSLFEGKFKSEYVYNDRYLKYLFSYIHLNPIKLIQKNWKEEGIKNKQKVLIFINNYKYSSYKDYLEIIRQENSIINKEFFPNYFPFKDLFLKEIFDWIKIKL
ncbi:MAG: transposase [Candidatus Paceibacterota bacterium]